ncbi:MAG: trigger factor [Desulfuromonadales bacterium]|nr:trigger factor [Desulfuromonadales bacterium]
MTVKIEDISSVRKKLSFEIAAAQVDAEFEQALQKVAKSAKIKGFRPGKIPRPVLEQFYGPQVQQQALERLIQQSYLKALAEHRIPALADPEIIENAPLEKGKMFSYEAQVEVKPQIEVSGYTGIKLEKENFEFDPKVIDGRLEEMRQGRAELKVVAREEAASGDFATIDFEGSVNGELFAGGAAQGHVLEIGSGSFIPGFEEQVIGMRRGESREIEVAFPQDYGNQELAGKPAVFKVTLHEIKEKTYPELSDEFAREFGLEGLAELREKIAETIRQQETSRIEGDLRERLVQALITRNRVEVPETMVAAQLDYMLDNVKRRLQSQGLGLQMLGMNEETFGQNYRATAISQVQGSLLLEAVARQENIRVEPDEIDGKIEEVAKMANAPLEAVRSYYSREEGRRSLIAQILEEKTVQFLLDKSEIQELEKSQLSGAGEKKEQMA